MLPLFSKQLEAVELDNINQLISEGYPEGSTVEYKESLPHSKGGQDPWFTGDSQIRDYARNKILAEVVAFANSHGGHVLIGIKESTEKPPRAEGISPIPRCAELAEKLRLMARDNIEPQLPVVMTWGVEVDPDGAGVVIIRVPQSRAAPHRLKPNKECYCGVRYSYGTSKSRHERSCLEISQEVLRDGLMEFSLIVDVEKFESGAYDAIFPEWVCGLTLNAILTAHRFRINAGAPEAEYGLEVEVWRTNGNLHVARLGNQFPIRIVGTAEPNPLAFQRLSFGPIEEVQKVIAILFRDLMNAAGADVGNAFEVVIPDDLVSS